METAILTVNAKRRPETIARAAKTALNSGQMVEIHPNNEHALTKVIESLTILGIPSIFKKNEQGNFSAIIKP